MLLVPRKKKARLNGADSGGHQRDTDDHEHSSKNTNRGESDSEHADADATLVLDGGQRSSVSSLHSGGASWSIKESEKLLKNISEVLPANDTDRLSFRLRKLDWSKIAVENRSADECHAQWKLLASNVRSFRIVREVLEDVRTWLDDQPKEAIPQPREKGQKFRIKKRHLDFPKKPGNAFNLFQKTMIPELHTREPSVAMPVIFKRSAELFRELPVDRKEELQREASEKLQKYHLEKERFAELHPGIIPASKLKKSILSSRPRLPKKPFSLYCQKKREELGGQRKISNATLESNWKTIGEEEKLEFIKLAVVDFTRYEKEIADYKEQHPEALVSKCRSTVSRTDMLLLDSVEPDVVEQPERGRPSRPLIPRSGYQLFLSEFLRERSMEPRLDNANWLTEAASEWNSFSHKLQRKYTKRINAIWDDYTTAFDEYLSSIDDEDQRNQEQRSFRLRNKKPITEDPGVVAVNDETAGEGEPSSKKKKVSKKITSAESVDPGGEPEPNFSSARKLFRMQNELHLQSLHPQMTSKEIRHQLNAEFKQLSENDKISYQTKAQALEEIF